jgi:hypothetical protein
MAQYEPQNRSFWALFQNVASVKVEKYFDQISNCVRFEVFTAVTDRMASSRMLHLAALVRTNVSEEFRASIIKVTRISGIGT